MNSTGKGAYSVDEFCERNGICRAFLYKLLKAGRGPRFMQVGSRKLFTVQAEIDWHKQMESETAAAFK